MQASTVSPTPHCTWPKDEAQSAVLAARSRAGAWQAPGFGVKSQKLRDKNETKGILCAGSSACATFTENLKGKLMCWNGIPPNSHREVLAFSSQLRHNAANLELILC